MEPKINDVASTSSFDSDNWGTPPPRGGSQEGEDTSVSPDTTPSRARNRPRSPGLFVSDDEEEPNYTSSSLPKLPKLPAIGMDGLARARAIKAKIENNIPVLKPLDKMNLARPTANDNPEDQIIQELRNNQDMGWSDIANFLNQERRNRGESAHLTANSVYSSYVRSITKIAVPVNEVGFDPKDYKYLRHPSQYASGEGTGTASKAGKKRVKNYDNAKELESNMRKLVSEDEFGDLETVEKTDQLVDAVDKVQRNFWTLVADEMERATTKLYPAGRLASRYHEL